MKHSQLAFLLGAAIFLWVISVILWCAAVASWAPFPTNGYAVRDAVLAESVIVACSSTTSAVLWRVVLAGRNGSFIASEVPYSFTGSPNATQATQAQYPLGVPTTVYAPTNPLPWSPPTSCTNLTVISYPSNGGIFVNVGAAEQARSTWLGIWIAFFVLFCIATPLCIAGAVWQYRKVHPKTKPMASQADE